MAERKLKVGDRLIVEVEVTRVSNDGNDVTIRLPGYGTPITLSKPTLEKAAPKR